MESQPSPEPLLQARSLRKIYPGGVEALGELSLEVRAGEVVGLLGPNGAGKTTALRILAAILTPTSGAASVCGFDTQWDPLAARRRLGFLSGNTALYRRLTPREVLFFFGRLHGMTEEAIAERSRLLLDGLEMGGFADRRCGSLSGGQLQRANIARTLIHDPPVLILDEPTTALDVITGGFILEAILRARASGKAILFSTHIMSEAEYLCDRIVVIHEGRVRGEGSQADLLARTGKSSLTAAFMGLLGVER